MVTAQRSARFPALDRYGRVLRYETQIYGIMEVDDVRMTDDVRAIPHVNPSLWLWDLTWLSAAIPRVTPVIKADGYGDERHMPPLISLAYEEGRTIAEVPLSVMCSGEALGVNRHEELIAARIMCGG